MALESCRSIAVFRALSGLGDILCIVPALRALRAAYTKANLTFIGLPQAEWLAQRLPHYVDRFVMFPGWPGLPEWTPVIQAVPPFLASAQKEGYDLALQMHGDGSSTNRIVALLDARTAAGFYRPEEWRPGGFFLPYDPRESEVRRYLHLLKDMGIPSQGDHLEFPVRDGDRSELQAISATHGLAFDRYICIHPGASMAARRWPAERFADVADRFMEMGYDVVLTGTAGEAPLTRTVARMMQHKPIDLAGRTTLGALAALVEGARLLVCNDTGVSHMADALRVPSVVIFTASDMQTASDPLRWAPLDTRLHRTLHERGLREPCARDRATEHRCLANVSSDIVLAEGRDLLAGSAAYAA